CHRMRARDPAPEDATPPTRVRAAALALLASALLLTGAAFTDNFASGLPLLRAGADGRPTPPPQPPWTSLSLLLDFPEHTRRARRLLRNPSGALRVPAGTTITVEMIPRDPDLLEHPERLQLTVVGDRGDAPGSEATVSRVPLARAPVERAPEDVSSDSDEGAPDSAPPRALTAQFTVRGPGSWFIDGDERHRHRYERSQPSPIQLEPDAAPEVELLPLPESRSAPTELDSVDIRFKARDDFGLASATLVFERPAADARGEPTVATARLSVGTPPDGARSWSRRYTWDLSKIAIEERTELTYWIEVRDNDPGLGLEPLPDPPGKVARSARMRLQVRDEESEHAANIEGLRELRDFAVDLLAARMMTVAFTDPDEDAADADEPVAPAPTRLRVRRARDLNSASGQLLASLGLLIDALSVDALTPERDVVTLSAIHGRLLALHKLELELHAEVAADLDRRAVAEELAAALESLLPRLGRHNDKEVAQLEDEIIRVDDLVDNQIIARLEQLVARLQASQQRLIELLELLRAGDESARGEIEQLHQRISDDLRRIAEARSMLRNEVGEEFMNLDAFQALEEQIRDQDVLEQVRRGNVDGALERARDAMDEIRSMRSTIQERMMQEDDPDARVSPEEQRRIKLLRELSRLQDEETSVRGSSESLHNRWRDAVAAQPLPDSQRAELERAANGLRERLDAINDARVGRDGRRGIEDAREALRELERAVTKDASARSNDDSERVSADDAPTSLAEKDGLNKDALEDDARAAYGSFGQAAAPMTKDAAPTTATAPMATSARRPTAATAESPQPEKIRAAPKSAGALESYELADELTRALDRALEGAETREREGQALKRLRDEARSLRDELGRALPKPGEVLGEDEAGRFSELETLQEGLRRRADELLGNEIAAQLPEEGSAALRRAGQSMQQSAERLGGLRSGEALDVQQRALDSLQRAIDSLRRSSPPAGSVSRENASTESERDRSLRDELLDAMREGAPRGFDAPVQRYYEELLR
ncbi:MAG: DUF4175 family protein, partial [Myxococcales bacterium]|nr:DUF4175 family protein [Myxococcales bacterium]